MAVFTDKAIAYGAKTERQDEWGICNIGILPSDAEIRDAFKA